MVTIDSSIISSFDELVDNYKGLVRVDYTSNSHLYFLIKNKQAYLHNLYGPYSVNKTNVRRYGIDGKFLALFNSVKLMQLNQLLGEV